MRYRIAIVCSSVILSGVAFLHCSSSDETTPAPDAAVDNAAPPVDDASSVDVVQDQGPVPSARKWRPQVLTLNLRPQPNAMFAPAPGNDPGFTIPFVQVSNNKAQPTRMPDAFADSKSVAGIGFGCVGYNFASPDPRDPKGPGLVDGDMGTVTINGFSGGAGIFPPKPPIPKPITCGRKEAIPGSGVFFYGCDIPPMPMDGFLKKEDMLMMSATGGADLGAWQSQVPPSPNDNIAVTPDLWNLPAEALNGSKDLEIMYNCGGDGMPCMNAAFVAIVIQTTDGNTKEAAFDPFAFPDPKKEFGLVQCFDWLSFNGKGYTVPKELLKVIPQTYTEARVVVATVIAASGQVDGQPSNFVGGFGRFGITHR